MYYMSNAFLLLSMDNCIAWLKALGDGCKHLRNIHLGEGVLDGAGWATTRNDQHHRVKVSCRLSKLNGLDADLSELFAEDVGWG